MCSKSMKMKTKPKFITKENVKSLFGRGLPIRISFDTNIIEVVFKNKQSIHLFEGYITCIDDVVILHNLNRTYFYLKLNEVRRLIDTK